MPSLYAFAKTILIDTVSKSNLRCKKENWIKHTPRRASAAHSIQFEFYIHSVLCHMCMHDFAHIWLHYNTIVISSSYLHRTWYLQMEEKQNDKRQKKKKTTRRDRWNCIQLGIVMQKIHLTYTARPSPFLDLWKVAIWFAFPAQWVIAQFNGSLLQGCFSSCLAKKILKYLCFST